MRAALVGLFRLLLGLFYRRIELMGNEAIPADRGVIFAVNHPNGLVDPLFVLCYSHRSVSFLAKAPLFGYPLIGWFVRRLDCIPVYRKQDETKGSNAETFSLARQVLAANGGIAIFPEGTTHSDSQLRGLKTGAARIALGSGTVARPVVVVPTGIYYGAKGTFRSDALVAFGRAIEVHPTALSAEGEPDHGAVERLTTEIEEGLSEVTLQADSLAALELVAMAEDLFSAADAPRVASEFTLRRRFVDGYHFLRQRDPARLARLESAVTQFAAELRRAGIEPHELVPRFRVGALLGMTALLPLALAGGLLHFPTYRIVGYLSRRFAKGEREMTATVKFLGALLLFPLTWCGYAVAAGWWLGWMAALAALIAVPLLGYAALRVFEKVDPTIGRLRAVVHRDRRERLIQEREAIRREIIEVAEEMERSAG